MIMTALDRYAGIGLRIGLLVLFFVVARTLLIPVVMGGLIAILLFPWRRRISSKPGRIRAQAPAILTAATLVLVMLPLVFVAAQAFVAGSDLLDRGGIMRSFNAATSALLGDVNRFTRPLGLKALDVKAVMAELGPRLATATTAFISATAAAIPAYAVDAFLFTVALYYFLRDGERLTRWVRVASPFSPTETEALFVAVDGTVSGAILGTLAVAVVQGGLTLVALLAMGVPGAFLWGVIAALCSFLPIVGTMPVTMGATAYFLFTGDVTRGIIMFVVALVIGTSDNVVRPWAQSSRDGMHPLLALLSIFGGLELFGPFGIFLGPISAAMALWALDTYGALRGDSKPTHSALIISPHDPGERIITTNIKS